MDQSDVFGISGLLTARIEFPPDERELAILRGMEILEDENGLFVGQRQNAFVNLGLHFLLDRAFNINTPNAAISHMGITDD